MDTKPEIDERVLAIFKRRADNAHTINKYIKEVINDKDFNYIIILFRNPASNDEKVYRRFLATSIIAAHAHPGTDFHGILHTLKSESILIIKKEIVRRADDYYRRANPFRPTMQNIVNPEVYNRDGETFVNFASQVCVNTASGGTVLLDVPRSIVHNVSRPYNSTKIHELNTSEGDIVETVKKYNNPDYNAREGIFEKAVNDLILKIIRKDGKDKTLQVLENIKKDLENSLEKDADPIELSGLLLTKENVRGALESLREHIQKVKNGYGESPPSPPQTETDKESLREAFNNCSITEKTRVSPRSDDPHENEDKDLTLQDTDETGATDETKG